MKDETRVSRRGLLVRASAGGLAGLVGTGIASNSAVTSANYAAGRLDLSRVTCADFAACLGTAFRICPARGPPTEVKLVRARELRPAAVARNEMRSPFRLVFRGRPGDALPQETYRMEHPRLGTMALFIVPVGLSGEEPAYVASFG